MKTLEIARKLKTCPDNVLCDTSPLASNSDHFSLKLSNVSERLHRRPLQKAK